MTTAETKEKSAQQVARSRAAERLRWASGAWVTLGFIYFVWNFSHLNPTLIFVYAGGFAVLLVVRGVMDARAKT